MMPVIANLRRRTPGTCLCETTTNPSLVAAQRRAAAERHPSIFDAMHRLGLVTGGTREQRDAAWVEGRWVEDSV